MIGVEETQNQHHWVVCLCQVKDLCEFLVLDAWLLCSSFLLSKIVILNCRSVWCCLVGKSFGSLGYISLHGDY